MRLENCRHWLGQGMSGRRQHTSIGSSRRQSSRDFGILGPALKSNARNSASSSTLCGREAITAQRNSRRSNSQFVLLISRNMRSYVPSGVSGNSSRAWADTHRKAVAEVLQLTIHPSEPTVGGWVKAVKNQDINPLHPIRRSSCQDVDNHLLVPWFPFSHFPIRVDY